ncbi:MAG TPA: twin-arginine translocase TatA/TatE family subunit [Verrucomicrobiae bacterium]|nr:twin-arginine translocase TatA/TatE family subunit [Verrucomicrobiae bacterium]
MLAPSPILLLGLVLVLALVVLGPKRLPELGSRVGRAIQEVKHASTQAAHGIAQVSAAAGAVATTTTTTTVAPATPAVTANGAGPMPVATGPGESSIH